MTKLSLAIALVAGSIAIAPAFAQDAKVQVQPYELQTEAGRAAVIDRIERAAHKACAAGTYTLAEKATVKDCTSTIGGQMIAKLNNPSVSLAWSGTTPKRVASR